MKDSPSPALDPCPHSLSDRIYSIYAPHIPARNKERFFAVLDDPSAPSANPSDPREPNPHPQWVMDALDKLDALLDPYRPLPDEARKARGAIRLACMDTLMKLQRQRRRRDDGEFQL